VEEVRLIRTEKILHGSSRRRHPPVSPGLLECLSYPLTDGPGVGLLIFLAPILLALSLPIFDVVAILEPITRGDWALGLLALPILSPLILVFSLVFGYALMFFGQMFVASALGEPEHPRWPEWDPNQISEGLGRWIWATVFGLALSVFPVVGYWMICGDIDWFDRVIFADLVIVCAGFALLTLAASLLHDSVLMANPFTVLGAAVQLGWDVVLPCVLGGGFLLLSAFGIHGVLYKIPSMKLAVLALWGWWVFVLYAVMVTLRALGLCYNAHAAELGWFHGRPKWGTPARFGRLYTNS
jgi:hypothetical protein